MESAQNPLLFYAFQDGVYDCQVFFAGAPDRQGFLVEFHEVSCVGSLLQARLSDEGGQAFAFTTFVILVPFLITFVTELGSTYALNFGAADIFLDWVFAGRACFCVFFYPLSTAFLIIDQLHPFGDIITSSRIVRLFPTEETVKLPTLTFHTDLAIVFGSFTQQITLIPIAGAKADGLIHSPIVDAHHFPVQLEKLREHSLHKTMQQNHTELALVHACEKYLILIQLRIYVEFPALRAVPMLAQHVGDQGCLGLTDGAGGQLELSEGVLILLEGVVDVDVGVGVEVIIFINSLFGPLMLVEQIQYNVILQSQRLSQILDEPAQTMVELLGLDEDKVEDGLFGDPAGVKSELGRGAGVGNARVGVGEDGWL